VVVLSVGADPEPGDLLVLDEPESAVSEGDADRVDRIAMVDPFEVQARMRGVLSDNRYAFRAASRISAGRS
jgi:hypothetical protein